MTSFVHRFTGRRHCALAIALVVATTLTSVATAFAYTSKMKVGKPTKTGRIWVEVALRRDGVGPATALVPVNVDSSWSANRKALEIAIVFNAVSDASKVRASEPEGGTEITFTGQNDWYVQLVGAAKDSTGEPDEYSLGPPTPISEQEGLCSLSGTAMGSDAQGGPGFVRMRVGGALASVQTSQGMPSAVVEQMLIGQLNGGGIPARFATQSDFAGGWEGLQHDTQVIWFPMPDTTGFFEQIGDVGLVLDLAAVLDGTPVPSSAPEGADASGLSLEVYPTLFSGDAVHVRFAAGGNTDHVRLEIFDVVGRKTRTLLDGGLTTSGALTWDGRDEQHTLLPGGLYFLRLSTREGDLVRRIVRLRR